MNESTTVAEPPRASRLPAEPSVNGDLRARVQQLRLGGGPGGGAKGSLLGGVTWLPWILCLALALTWAGVAMRSYRNAPKDGDGGPVVLASGSNTGTGGSNKPGTPASVVNLVVKGYIVPARQITVSPIDVGGKLIELNVVEGKLYHKDKEVLAKIDPVSYEASAAEARASVGAAKARLTAAEQRKAEQDPKNVRQIELDQVDEQLKEAKANEQRAKRDYDRLVNVRDPGSVAGRELQQAEGDFKAAAARVRQLQATLDILIAGPRPEKMASMEADVQAAKADVAVAQARLTQAEWRLSNCVIRAPITGIALTKKAELGNLVNPMAFNGGGGIVDLADMSEPEVDLKVAERDISGLVIGQKCQVTADAYAGREYVGVLDRIMPVANQADNTINVRVKVTLPADERDNPGRYLRPSMGATVRFLAADAKKEESKRIEQ